MPAKKRSPSAPAYDFPFFGAGEASYFEWAEVHVRFARTPTRTEKAAIRKRVPPPLRDSIDWEGEQLMAASGQFAHVVIADTYPADAQDADDDDNDDDDEDDGEFGSRFFFAATSQVRKFNQDIEEWLRLAHASCPILLAYRGEDSESGGTELSAWHTFSLKQLPRLWEALAPILQLDDDAKACFMLRGVLHMSQEGKAPIPLPEPFQDWLEPGKKELAALQKGDAAEFQRLLSARPAIRPATLAALADAVRSLEDGAKRILLDAAQLILAQHAVPTKLIVGLVGAALRLAPPAADARAAALLAQAARQAHTDSELANELGVLGHALAVEGRFLPAIALFDAILDCPGLDRSAYCNALWVRMEDNSKLPLDRAQAERFLASALPHGPHNPAIYYNAACLYMELGQIDQVLANLHLAIHHRYDKPEQMRSEAMFRPIADDPRFLAIFTPPAAAAAAGSKTRSKTATKRPARKKPARS